VLCAKISNARHGKVSKRKSKFLIEFGHSLSLNNMDNKDEDRTQAPHTLLPTLREIFSLEPYGVFLPKPAKANSNGAPPLTFDECEQIEKLLHGTVPFQCNSVLGRRPSLFVAPPVSPVLSSTPHISFPPPPHFSSLPSSPGPPFHPLRVDANGDAETFPLQQHVYTDPSLFKHHDYYFAPSTSSVKHDVEIAFDGAYGGAAARAIDAREKGRVTDTILQRDMLQRRSTSELNKEGRDIESKKNK
jgi:hypothetical protein